MAETVSVDFPLKTNSAKSFKDLMAKAKSTPESFVGEVVQWYAYLVKKFNDGCDILEMKRDETHHHLVDLFDEAAHATKVDHFCLEFEPESAAFLKAKFNTSNLSNIMMNAFYSFDRALDTEARKSLLIAVNPSVDIPSPVIYALQTRLVQKGPI